MKLLIEAGFIQEKRDWQSLAYVLQQPNMLAVTGYKVLRNQQKKGFATCVKTTFNGRDKLLYNVEKVQPLSAMLPTLEAGPFLQIINNILTTFCGISNVGFLYPANIETDPSSVFVNPVTNQTSLIYLPIREDYNAYMNGAYEANLKQIFIEIIQAFPKLQTPAVQPLWQALCNPGATLEQLRPLTGVGTGGIGTSNLQPTTASINNATQQEMPAQPPEKPVESGKKKGFLSNIFKPKPKEELTFTPGAQGGETTVLEEIFGPSIVFVGIKTKEPVEFVIDKAEYTLGKNAGMVDGALPFNGAISRMHCKIIYEDGQNKLVDLGSANGTFVNGEKLTPNAAVPIAPGDAIQLANSNFTIKAI